MSIIVFSVLQFRSIEISNLASYILAWLYLAFAIGITFVVGLLLCKYKDNLYVEPDKYDDYTLDEKLKMDGFRFRALWQFVNTKIKFAHYYYLMQYIRKIYFAFLLVFLFDSMKV